MTGKLFAGAAAVVAFLVAWQLLPDALGIRPLIWPPLDAVLERFWRERVFIGESLLETAIATLLAVGLAYVAAFLLTALSQLSPLLQAALDPFIVAGQALPKVVLVPLLFLMISQSMTPAILVGALIAFFPVFMAMRFAIETLPQSLRDLATVWGYRRLSFLRQIALPFSIPTAASMLKVAWIYAMIGVVTTEMLKPQMGIGFLISEAQHRIDGPLYYAAALASLLLAIGGWGVGLAADATARKIFRLERAVEPFA